jgi:hypothetical protein
MLDNIEKYIDFAVNFCRRGSDNYFLLFSPFFCEIFGYFIETNALVIFSAQVAVI